MAGETGGVRLLLSVPAAALGLFEAALQRLGGATVTGPPDTRGPVALEAYFATRPDPAALNALLAAAAAAAGTVVPEFVLECLPPLDWAAESQKARPPVRAGRFYLFGAHLAGSPPAGTIAIRIDAGRAFGTGHHESTRGCLMALDALARRARPQRPLDLGCGAGVLAIAMAKLWPALVMACDVDPVAVQVTRTNARLNAVAPRVRTFQADGFRHAALVKGGPYDLIAANVLAGPLIRMAGDLRRSLAPRGIVILSGLLRGQERAVTARYRSVGLARMRRIALGDWVTLVLTD
jgi:ribosomal protein L11 methyltransferase